MSFTNKRKSQLGVRSLGDMIRSGEVKDTSYSPLSVDTSKFILGPDWLDDLIRRWSRGDLVGVLAGAGVGKTTVILNILYHILKNNEDKEDAFVTFVSLELTAQEVADKWFRICGEDQHLIDRFYIIENYDESGKCKELTPSKIKVELSKIIDSTSGDLLAFVIDHLHEIENNGSTDYNPVVKSLKNVAVETNSVGFILSQTTKGKGIGDIPIPKDGCYGCSRFEWLCSYIISVSQPLLRVNSKCSLSVVALQYSKIRYKNKTDNLKEMMNYLFHYDFDTQRITPLNPTQKSEFAIWYEQVLELRDAEEKFKTHQYDISTTIKNKDGKEVDINRIVGGTKPESDEEYDKKTTPRSFRR